MLFNIYIKQLVVLIYIPIIFLVLLFVMLVNMYF